MLPGRRDSWGWAASEWRARARRADWRARCKPALHGFNGQVERCRDLRRAQALHVAQQQYFSLFIREPRERALELNAQLAAADRRLRAILLMRSPIGSGVFGQVRPVLQAAATARAGDKYRAAAVRAVENCKVKKTIAAQPSFEVTLEVAGAP